MKHLLVIAPIFGLILMGTVMALAFADAITFPTQFGLVTFIAWIVVGASVAMSLAKALPPVLLGAFQWMIIAVAGEAFLGQVYAFPGHQLLAHGFASVTVLFAAGMLFAYVLAGREALDQPVRQHRVSRA